MSVRRAGSHSGTGREWIGALVLAAIGIGCRLAFVSAFPTLPVSDFRALIGFGLRLRDHGLAAPSWLWVQFNSGLPILLAVLYRLAPHGGPAAARLATAVWTGLLPLLPFLMWRGVLSFRVRLVAGALLALWPGQVFFCGVVAQDNWVLVPVVALAALSVRRVLDPRAEGYPVAAGLLLACATAIRQEMLLVLLPLLFAAAFGGSGRRRFLRNGALLLVSVGLPLLALAWQRDLATGRFALTTEHGGLAMLGSFVPGASSSGWKDPHPWVATADPSILTSPRRLEAGAMRLALGEARRRPAFHAVRIATGTLRLAVESDADNLYWSVRGPGVLPAARQSAGSNFSRAAADWLYLEMAGLQGLFAAAVVLGLRRRDPAILLLAAAALLKLVVHAVISPMPRLVVPATALELLTLPLLAALWASVSTRGRAVLAVVAVSVPLSLVAVVPKLQAAVARRDRDEPRAYRFPLSVAGLRGPVWCDMDSGHLPVLDWGRATIETLSADPAPGDRAHVVCVVPPLDSGESLLLRLEDRYAPGHLPGRMVERVEVEGREVLRHDVAAEPGAGWLEIPIAGSERGATRVAIEILAVAPDPGWSWGRVTTARFEFVRRAAP